MIDQSDTVKELRKKYPEFIYENYTIEEDETTIYLKFHFCIPNLSTFQPCMKIMKKDYLKEQIKGNPIVENLVFHIGLIELISYWKCTFSPNVIVKCGQLDQTQKEWLKKLYYSGVGELMYTNGIKINYEEFMHIESTGKNILQVLPNNMKSEKFSGFLIPIGGGKDSVVTLENLPVNRERDYCLILNPKPVTLSCAQTAGFKRDHVVEIIRNIDKNLLELNQQGYINGHTPFSALLSFVSYLIAYLTHKKMITLSNESSANESNVKGEKINHQYSKTYEYENDFDQYSKQYLKIPIQYFSFLRPLNELQIAKLFSRYEQYHSIFKSCNVGSKNETWNWCGNCPKCLFVFSILSPFLYREKLVKIFGKDLFEDETLTKTFIELNGYGEIKPFECVGTFEEMRYAVCKTIQMLEDKKENLPYLLRYYKENYELVNLNIDITKRYNEQNNLPENLNNILKEAILND